MPTESTDSPASIVTHPHATPQLTELRALWPQTYQAITNHYYTQESWVYTYCGTRNDAGLLLWGLRRFAGAVRSLHSHREYSQQTLDRCVAQEIRYHAYRATEIRRPAAFFSAAIYRIVTERPELLERAARLTDQLQHAERKGEPCHVSI